MNRVVVTGIGVMAPGSIGAQDFWKNISRGNVCTGEISLPFYEDLRVKIAGKIENFDETEFLTDKNGLIFKNLDITDKYALKTIDMALKDSQINLDNLKNKLVLSLGTTMVKGSIELNKKIDYKTYERLIKTDKDTDNELLQRLCPIDILATICKYFNLKNVETRMFLNACAAGNYSINWGSERIKNGDAKVAIVGGVDSFSLTALIGFNRLLSLTPNLCRPFDKNRKGLIVSEGCGILVLENLNSALARGAHIYGEIKGCGLSVDAYHITSPRPDASGVISCVEKALKKSQLLSTDIDYISAHGTGTKLNDKIEAKALCSVFKNNVPPVSSIKSMIGHSLGAAAAVEAVACLLMIQHNLVVPTANFEEADEECPIDCIPNKSRPMEINNIISNAFAFGGNNSSLVISRYKEG